MSNSSFVFNNIDSSNYMIVNVLPSIIRATKDIQKIEVIGRDGFLSQDLGSYRSTVKTVECTLKDLSQIDYICSWLTGSGDVIFSNEPDKIYKATVINQIEFIKVLRTFHRFLIQFECQPKKFALSNATVTLTSAGSIINPSATSSNPIITVYGTGNINLAINLDIYNLYNVVGWVTIDSYFKDCYKGIDLKNADTLFADFPVLKAGNNTFTWTGTVSKVEIIPNFCYL